MYTAFGGAPWLIRSGVPEDNILECRGANKEGTGACTSTVAQTAVAISEDGRWLYLVVANGVNAVGITGFITRTLQPQEAIKLDGGGSSQMWYGGLPEDQRVVDPGDGRQLSQYLAIIAPSGDGIDLEPPTPEPPPGSGNWWDSLLQNIEQRWEGILSWWDSLPQNIRQWWESTLGGFQQRMSEWWQRQQEELKRRMLEELEQAISQLCATAAIPGSIVTVFWIQNRRRRRRG